MTFCAQQSTVVTAIRRHQKRASQMVRAILVRASLEPTETRGRTTAATPRRLRMPARLA